MSSYRSKSFICNTRAHSFVDNNARGKHDKGGGARGEVAVIEGEDGEDEDDDNDAIDGDRYEGA